MGLPALVGLVAGSVAAAGTGVLAVWLASSLTLGEYGIRMRDMVRALVVSRLRPVRLRVSRSERVES